jgi:hypothetical protein
MSSDNNDDVSRIANAANTAEETEAKPLDPKIAAWLKRGYEIREITRDHGIRHYWSFWDERTPGRIDFVIHANIIWNTERDSELDVGIGWVRPTPYDPVRSGPEPEFELPFKPAREYGAGVPVSDVPTGDTKRAYEALGLAVDRASFFTNCLSFLSGFPAHWRPARIIQFQTGGPQPVDEAPQRYKRYVSLSPQDEMTSINVDDKWMHELFKPLAVAIWTLPMEEIRRVLLTAISWQAQANVGSGLGRYLHYFASVELLANYFYDHLPSNKTGKTPESEIRQRILELLLSLDGKNYMSNLRQCSDMLEPSVRSKIKSLGKLVDFDVEVFFQRAQRDGKSLIDIRNDIAHGNIAHDDREYIRTNQEALDKFQPSSREFVVRVSIAAAQGKLNS